MKKIINFYIRFVQKILIVLLLTILYFLVFGITRLLLVIFPNKNFRHIKNATTYWIPAKDDGNNESSAFEQS